MHNRGTFRKERKNHGSRILNAKSVENPGKKQAEETHFGSAVFLDFYLSMSSAKGSRGKRLSEKNVHDN